MYVPSAHNKKINHYMKKHLIGIALLTIASTVYAKTTDTLSGKNRKKVNEYFTQALNGNNAEFRKSIKVDNIDKMQSCVWAAWRECVEQLKEEKLIELGCLQDKKVGQWTLPEELEPNAIMPYYFGINEAVKEDEKVPFFLYMHGSGHKKSEWETGIKLCTEYFYKPAAYMVPQIPNMGEYYRWAIPSKQWAWEKLLRLLFLNDKIDANRIYFFGISEGGYGSQRLAAFYADYLAGAGPMAGGEPLKNAPMENVANIAFSLRTGAQDYMFGRSMLTNNARSVADSLAQAHPGYYNHYIEVIPGYGHGIDYRPTTPWLATHKRNPHPKYFYWENFDMYGRYRKGFHNLRVNSESRPDSTWRTCYEMEIKENTVYLNVNLAEYTTTMDIQGIDMLFSKKFHKATDGSVTIFLNNNLVDLSRPVKVIVNGKEVFNNKVKPNVKAMVESCALFFDSERIFPASIDIDIK